MGKTRDLFKKTRDLFQKTRDTKEILHAKMGTVKDRNSMDLTEAEKIKKVKVGLRKHCCSVTYLSNFL